MAKKPMTDHEKEGIKAIIEQMIELDRAKSALQLQMFNRYGIKVISTDTNSITDLNDDDPKAKEKRYVTDVVYIHISSGLEKVAEAYGFNYVNRGKSSTGYYYRFGRIVNHDGELMDFESFTPDGKRSIVKAEHRDNEWTRKTDEN